MKQRPKRDHSINTLITVGAIAATLGGWAVLSREIDQPSPSSPPVEEQSRASINPVTTVAPTANQPPRIEQRQPPAPPRAITKTRSSR